MEDVNQQIISNILLETVLMKFIGVERIRRKGIAKENLGKRGVHRFLNKRDGKNYVYLIFLTKIDKDVVQLKVALEKDYYDNPIQHFKRSFPFEKGKFYSLTLRVYNFAEAKNKGCIFFLECYKKASIKKVKENLKKTLLCEKDYVSGLDISKVKLISHNYLFQNENNHNLVIESHTNNQKTVYRITSLFRRDNPSYQLFINNGVEGLLKRYDKNDFKKISNNKWIVNTESRPTSMKFTLNRDKIYDGYFLKIVS